MQLVQNWNESKLEHYLLFGHWKASNAWRVIAGLEYDDPWPNDEKILTKDQLKLNEFDYFCELQDMKETVTDLRRLWLSDLKDEDDLLPPYLIIDWALSKRIRPAWLDWAVEKNLYVPRSGTTDNIKSQTNFISESEKTVTNYSTKWLLIQQDAISQFFQPRRNPDAKKEEIIEWINSQAVVRGLGASNNIASTIFTIIKPENHDPKKTRGESLSGQ
jgi:hypothetical protein